jgi:hypothetical protein
MTLINWIKTSFKLWLDENGKISINGNFGHNFTVFFAAG